jgi:hypothetical protein
MSDNLPAQINVDESGVLKPRNIDEAYRLAKAYVMSGILPERYKTAESVLTAMQFALELGLKPLTAMRQIAVVKGTPCLFGDLPLSLCYSSGKLEAIKEVWLDKDGREINLANKNLTAQAYAAFCVVKRKGDPEPLEAFFTMDDAQNAGLLNSPTWKAYPKRMLRYRARSQALKDKFPDCLNGISIAEYDQNTVEEQILNVTPQVEVAWSSEASPSEGPAPERKETLQEKLARKMPSSPIIDAEIQ